MVQQARMLAEDKSMTIIQEESTEEPRESFTDVAALHQVESSLELTQGPSVVLASQRR